MKIGYTPPIHVSQTRVKERDGDKHEGAGKNAYQNPNQNQGEKQESEYEVQAADVQKAIETLNGDENQTGVHAATEGEGPGLRVKLTDGAGGILRTVSGEEFLKLREAIHGGKVPGKILDKKV